MTRRAMSLHRRQNGPIAAAPVAVDLNIRAGSLAAELVRMVESDEYRGFEKQSSFIGPDTNARTRKIGEELHRLGGLELMTIVHSIVLARTDRLSAAMLNHVWDAIGERKA